MSTKWQLSRRTFLRGAGTAVALPLLDAMLPALARGGQAAAVGPKRMAFLYVPNGAHMPEWTPAQLGRGYTLPKILAPLAPHQDDLLVLSGLAHDKARANGDGGGDHARSVATFLTGCQPHKTGGKDIRAGISVDQVAAQRLGGQTPLASLELGCDPAPRAGVCDTGYSCAYSTNLSWRTETTPMPKEINPRAVFDRLFPSAVPKPEIVGAARFQQSVLDLVLEDARRLQSRLGQSDRRKLDEYLTSVRSLEQRIDRIAFYETDGEAPLPRPAGIPSDYAEHLRLMCDLMAFAFQLDLTRISTFMFANATSNRSYPMLDVPEGHHYLSHHGGNEEKQAKIAKINHFHIEQFAHLLTKLKSMPEGEATVLDNSMIVYGSGIADGDRHSHHDLPILLAGRGAGTVLSGRHVRYAEETPLMNLYLAMLDRMEVKVDALGDSTGLLPGLDTEEVDFAGAEAAKPEGEKP